MFQNQLIILIIYCIIFSVAFLSFLLITYCFFYVLYIFFVLPSKVEITFFNYIGKYIKLLFSGISTNFPIKYVNKDSINFNRRYLYIFIPHGLITFSQIIHSLDPKSPLQDLKISNAVHSYCFRIPIIREIALLIGGIPVDKYYINKYLTTNSSVSITVGGMREISYALDNNKDDRLFIKNRKGFIKIAKQNSVEIVPIYCWNEQQFLTYQNWIIFDILNKLLSKLFGRCIEFHFLQTLLPEKLNKIIESILGSIQGTKLYIGEPININDLSIDDAHDLYICKIKELFAIAAKSENSDKKLIIE